MEIAYSKTREQFPLSTKKIIKKTIASTFALLIPLLMIVGLIIFNVVLNNGNASTWISVTVIGFLVLLFLIFPLFYLYQRWYFTVYFYDLTSDFIQIRKGPIVPREINIPYERLQDVYVDQDILDRIFGLYDVHISSATFSSGMEAHIDGVEKQSAEGLRTILLETIKQKINKNRFTDSPIANPAS